MTLEEKIHQKAIEAAKYKMAVNMGAVQQLLNDCGFDVNLPAVSSVMEEHSESGLMVSLDVTKAFNRLIDKEERAIIKTATGE